MNESQETFIIEGVKPIKSKPKNNNNWRGYTDFIITYLLQFTPLYALAIVEFLSTQSSVDWTAWAGNSIIIAITSAGVGIVNTLRQPLNGNRNRLFCTFRIIIISLGAVIYGVLLVDRTTNNQWSLIISVIFIISIAIFDGVDVYFGGAE